MKLWKTRIAMDALAIRPDGSSINFGDAIYHPENVEEAKAYVKMKNDELEES
jgi:hypothetical protein